MPYFVADGAERIVDLIVLPIKDEAGRVMFVAPTGTDITDRKRAEEEVRLSHARFEAVLDAAPIGVYLVDADLRIRQVNPKARPVFGDIEGLIGGDFVEVIHVLWPPAYAAEVVGRFRHTLATGEPCLVPERIEERLDRRVLEYYEWQVHRISLPGGQYGVVCYFSDISRHVLARQALAEADRRKDEFLATLAHELRNPLAPIRTGLQILKHSRGGQPRRRAPAGDDGAAGRAPGPAGGRPDGRVPDQPRGDRTPQGGRGLATVVDQAVAASRPFYRGAGARAERRASRTGPSGWRPTRPAWSRSSPTCWTTPPSTPIRGAASGWTPAGRGTRSSSASGTRGSASPPRCCRRSSTCSCRSSGGWTARRAAWASA